MVETYYGPKPERVHVEHLDGRTHVWLVKDAERDTVDRGPDEHDAVEVYTGKTLYFTMWGTVAADEVERGFDVLWSEHELDGIGDAERIGAVEQATTDNGKQLETAFQALAELGDMIATVGGGA